MRNAVIVAVISSIIASFASAGADSTRAPDRSKAGLASGEEPAWQQEFNLSARKLSSSGRNPFFILEPGYQAILESEREKLAITVLDETKDVDGVATRVVEEREWKNGKLIEVSRNFFAICEKSKDVFYFGEDVDVYKNGKAVRNSDSWLAGKKGARAGMIMPGKPKPGMKYFQELAPGVAMDRTEVVGLDEALMTPAGTFSHCLKTREGTALDPDEAEFKIYAPGIGLIQDEDLLLTRHGFITKDDQK